MPNIHSKQRADKTQIELVLLCVNNKLLLLVEFLALVSFFDDIDQTRQRYGQLSLALNLVHVTHAMNWTGGRLQRYSLGSRGNSKSLRAVQKQHFARKRLAARNGRAVSVSPIKLLVADGAKLGEKSEGDNEVDERKQLRTVSRSEYFDNDGGQDPAGGPCGGRESQDAQDNQHGQSSIDTIRRNLLRQNDWAKLSLARPLIVDFPASRAERANVAKRRRLTEDERRGNRVTTITREEGPYYTRPTMASSRLSSSVLNSDGISIQIGEPDVRRAVSATPYSQGRTMYMLSQATSSDSMLFDGEDRSQISCRNNVVVERGDARYTMGWTERGEDEFQMASSGIRVPESVEYWIGERRAESNDGDEAAESLTMSTEENSVPLPTLDPRGSFKRMPDGKTKYVPPHENENVPKAAAVEGEPGDFKEKLLTTSCPRKSGPSKQRHVPLWITGGIDTDTVRESEAWNSIERGRLLLSTSTINQKSRAEEDFSRAHAASTVRDPAKRQGTKRQGNLYIDQEGRVSITDNTERPSARSSISASSIHRRSTSTPAKQRNLYLDQERRDAIAKFSEKQMSRNPPASVNATSRCHRSILSPYVGPGENGAALGNDRQRLLLYAPRAEEIQSNNYHNKLESTVEPQPTFFGQTVDPKDAARGGCQVDDEALWKRLIFGES
ncbi:hypothetical protein VTO42DRAFT_7219 [Malbranchea cinnamomea]